MIKTYDRVDPARSAMTFAARRMEDIQAERGGAPDAPHRHDFYLVLLVEEASGTHAVDFREHPLRGGQVWFLAPGQVHRIVERGPSRGCVFSFSTAFLLEHHIPERFLTAINLFRPHGDSPPLEPEPARWAELRELAHRAHAAFAGGGPFALHATAAWLKLFLIAANEACRRDPAPESAPGQAEQLVSAYKELVDGHFAERHQVGWYAEALHVSPDHLNRTVKAATGRSAKAFLQARLAVAARRLLLFTDASAKEIGYELGFADPAHFSHFFKRQTGESPAAFRAGQGR